MVLFEGLILSRCACCQVPSANAIFFNGDRVEGTGHPVVEKLSDTQNIADILVSKFGDSINAWVIQASTFNGPFAVYNDFIPSVNRYGEPKIYDPIGFPASASTVSILSSCLKEVTNRGNFFYHSIERFCLISFIERLFS